MLQQTSVAVPLPTTVKVEPTQIGRPLSFERILGAFLGVGIGDALGLPVECRTAEYIRHHYGRVERYLDPHLNDHISRDFAPGVVAPGTTSDDWQLTEAVGLSIVAEGAIDLVSIGRAHVTARDECTLGWGGATRSAATRLANGASIESAADPGTGEGCGPVMKLSPVVMKLAQDGRSVNEVLPLLAAFTTMTHKTNVAIVGTFAFAAALEYVLRVDASAFNSNEFVGTVISHADLGRAWLPDLPADRVLSDRLKLLHEHRTLDLSQMLQLTDGARPPMASCLPFALFAFLKNPQSFECLIDVVNSGGDTDSTGGLVGALVGGLNGVKIIPEHLIAGLQGAERMRVLASKLSGGNA